MGTKPKKRRNRKRKVRVRVKTGAAIVRRDSVRKDTIRNDTLPKMDAQMPRTVAPVLKVKIKKKQ